MKRIRITESEFKGIIRKSVLEAVNERWENVKGTPMKKRDIPPTVTLKVYKQVMLRGDSMKTGLVYPLYVDSTSGWEIGQWYDAGIGDYRIEIDDETNEPTGRVKVPSKVGGLAFRPGLHFGSVPYAPHIFTKKPNFGDEKKPENLDSKGRLRKDYDYSKTRLQKNNVVWAECEISFDKDYNEEARRNGTYVNKKGKEINNPMNSCLKRIPTDGAYEFRTNTNAPSWQTWYIAGSFKICRLLPDEEVRELCRKHNVISLDRDGVLDLSSFPSEKITKETDLPHIVKETVGSYIYDIIKESKMRLNETHTSILYHFTPLHLFSRIMDTDTLAASDNERKYSNNKNYISLTRNGNPKEGYPAMAWSEFGGYGDSPCVRIELDGDKLKRFSNFKDSQGKQHNIKIKPFDWSFHDIRNNEEGEFPTWVSGENGKEWMMGSNETMHNVLTDTDMTDKYAHPYSQAEDRLTTTANGIPNISKYINSITIYTPKDFQPTDEDSQDISKARAYSEAKGINFKMMKLYK